MRRFTFFLLLLYYPAFVFPQLEDNFNDGRFYGDETNPRAIEWMGDREHFIINDQLQLQLNAPAVASSSYLRTKSAKIQNTAWECFVKMDFALTNSNYCKIHLSSDREDLNDSPNGIYVRIGYTDKNISLIYSQDGKNKTLIKGIPKRLTDPQTSVFIKVSYDKYQKFKLFSKLPSEEEYVLEGECSFSEKLESEWFGLSCIYTKTRNKHFYFDDCVIRELSDEEQGEPDDPDPPLDIPQEGDIVFSEIMANPSGNTDQYPEYIEFYNCSEKSFQLSDCLFFYGDKSFPLKEYVFEPDTYLVLCKNTAIDQFDESIHAIGVNSFPVLANTGKLLMLKTEKENMISWIEYSDKMYNDAEKKNGGWSLECVDLTNRSNSPANWEASTDPTGGTPGKENSVQATNPDLIHPEISHYYMEEEKMHIFFSKPMNRQTLLDPDSYIYYGERYLISDLYTNDPQGTVLTIIWDKEFNEGDFIELTLKKLTDRTGNALIDETIIAGHAYTPLPNDLLINELLFNPPAGGNEYVELYNHSDKLIDLRKASITTRKPSDGSFNKPYPLSDWPLFLYPEEYLVISKDRSTVCEYYTCMEESLFTELPLMPSIANKSGCLVILNDREEIVDEFAYDEKMHSDNIKNKKGVSLERMEFDIPTQIAENWKSAEEESGFGTPGYKNSVKTTLPDVEYDNINKVWIEYPDLSNNNYRINYQLDKAGYIAHIYLYDASGRMLCSLISNEIMDKSGVITWDGKSTSNQKLTGGIYILFTELLDQKGKTLKFKIPVVVR